MNIHVIGVGAIGSIVSANLRRTLPPTASVTLMLKRPSYTVNKDDFGHSTPITIHRSDISYTTTGFNWELVAEGSRGYQPSADEVTSTSQSHMLRDLVFNSDGSVRKSFGLAAQGMEEYKRPESNAWNPYGVEQQSGVFRTVAKEYSEELAQSQSPIQHLLVVTKAGSVLSAISSIRHRLSSSSTIALLQNGMGLYEQIISELYRNAEDRPHFILGSLTHGAWKKAPNEIIHTSSPGTGSIRFGIVPDWRGRDFERSYWEAPNSKKAKLKASDINTPSTDEAQDGNSARQDYTSLYQMVNALQGLEDLNSGWEPISDVQTAIRQKLAANCVINPLTSLLGVRNGELFALPFAKGLCQKLCKESAAVFAAEAQHQSGHEHVKFKTDPILLGKELESYTHRIARMTGRNYSSMLVDVRRGSTTEIGYLNDYVTRIGEELGVETPYHGMLSALVKMKWHTGLSNSQQKRRFQT